MQFTSNLTSANPVCRPKHLTGFLLQRKCNCGAGTASLSGVCEECDAKRLQTKLTSGKSDDAYEREADRVAQIVLNSTPLAENAKALTISSTEQHPNAQVAGSKYGLTPITDAALSSSRTALDMVTCPSSSLTFGHDFSRVKVHSGHAYMRRLDVAEIPAVPQMADTSIQDSAQPSDDPHCLHMRPGEGPDRCEFTPKQQHALSFVRYAALSLASQALMNLGREDPYMAALAARIFHVQAPDMDKIASTTSQILINLRSKPIVCGSCADEDCYQAGVVAHVSDDLSTVIICQRSFQTGPIQMRRTLIHEAGHAAGVDSSLTDVSEAYCPENSESCLDPCSNLTGDLSENVDAWARFIECAAYSG
jgi:hypothetical protein